jgi:hypothetical protein
MVDDDEEEEEEEEEDDDGCGCYDDDNLFICLSFCFRTYTLE